MKYPEHISEFWRVRSLDSSLSNTDFALYSYLCNCLNQTHWSTDTITQRRELICGLLGINGNTLEESRNRLKQKGFIDFITVTTTNKNGKKQGVKGASTTYIILNSVRNSVLNGTLNEHETDTKRTRNGTVLINRNRKKNNINNTSISDYQNKVEQELASLDLEGQNSWQKFQEWYQSQGFKKVTQIEEQLTPKQFLTLQNLYGASSLIRTLSNMENYKKVTGYTSVYLTLNNWLSRDNAA